MFTGLPCEQAATMKLFDGKEMPAFAAHRQRRDFGKRRIFMHVGQDRHAICSRLWPRLQAFLQTGTRKLAREERLACRTML